MWYDISNTPISSIEQMPKNAIGFVYHIVFEDGKQYIGKKNLYSITTLKALKSGKPREGSIKITKKRGTKELVETVKKESDWQTYQGSHTECKTRKVKKKYIIQYAFSKLELTYLEAKYLFAKGVLEDDRFINDNILGTFYRSNLHVSNELSEESS